MQSISSTAPTWLLIAKIISWKLWASKKAQTAFACVGRSNAMSWISSLHSFWSRGRQTSCHLIGAKCFNIGHSCCHSCHYHCYDKLPARSSFLKAALLCMPDLRMSRVSKGELKDHHKRHMGDRFAYLQMSLMFWALSDGVSIPICHIASSSGMVMKSSSGNLDFLQRLGSWNLSREHQHERTQNGHHMMHPLVRRFTCEEALTKQKIYNWINAAIKKKQNWQSQDVNEVSLKRQRETT